jgi:hypothetical protein
MFLNLMTVPFTTHCAYLGNRQMPCTNEIQPFEITPAKHMMK